MSIKHYDTLDNCRLQRRDDSKVVIKENHKPPYITPTRAGNKAFPTFDRLKDKKEEKGENENDS